MTETFDIAGYCRISVDEELDKDNVSIENQKSIIRAFVQSNFPGSTLTFYEDRDKSGYTFDQRDGYQKMRKGLVSHQYDILIVKDFSRFSRRNSRGLVELEDLRDAGARIISIGDGIDFPNDDDWLKIQFQFLINEMPVTDASKKVRSVIRRRQADGQWICTAPYGYIINKRKQFEIVPTEAEIVRLIYKLYNEDGWGYKKISNHLTEMNIPTPRMSAKMRAEAEGIENKIRAKTAWSIVTIQEILDNDFYIGTLRQAKYTRAKINGKDVKRDESEHIVIENHHQAIIDYRTFATTRELRKHRTKSNYRGVRIYDNAYSGYLFCGDCGAPLFSMSRSNLAPAYTCGTYHRRGLAGCTSHHVRVDVLDKLLKIYIKRVVDNSSEMIDRINEELKTIDARDEESSVSVANLTEILVELQEELKVTKRQRIREIMKHPEREGDIEAMYDELEADLQKKIDGMNNQIILVSDKRNAMIQAGRKAKTALDIFNEILAAPSLPRNTINLIVEKIVVYQDHIEIKLHQDIDALLQVADKETPVNFNCGIKDNSYGRSIRLVQKAKNQRDKVFDVNIISNGDPSLTALTQIEAFCYTINDISCIFGISD